MIALLDNVQILVMSKKLVNKLICDTEVESSGTLSSALEELMISLLIFFIITKLSFYSQKSHVNLE